MQIKFDAKFADNDLDEFVARIYHNLTEKPSDSYIFDFSETEHIGNQELLILTAIFSRSK